MKKTNFSKVKSENPNNNNAIVPPDFKTIMSIANTIGMSAGDIFSYMNDFSRSFVTASNYFKKAELEKMKDSTPAEIIISYSELLGMNLNLAQKSMMTSLKAFGEYTQKDSFDMIKALMNSLFSNKGDENLEHFFHRKLRMLQFLTKKFPEAIKCAEDDFGFHFERGQNKKIAETKRFILYKIAPTNKKVKTDDKKKPILIIPPYVLGANILSFLPDYNKSYTHNYANKGIPTYIRIRKDILSNEAVQVMTPEDDATDTAVFCKKIKKAHGKKVTLNGYCQGGFFAVCNILSGVLDGLVDTLITCVAPMDGTKNKGLGGFLDELPKRFNDLSYGLKTLPNGNNIADGNIMAWVYKLKSIENEFPVATLFRDISMFDYKGKDSKKINKTIAAINFWLSSERTDIPLEITRFSFDSFNIPVAENGDLPVKLFNRKLNFKRIKEKNIKWLICYGENDDLVEKESALAPLDFVPAEVTSFPKGHVAIVTSWSEPSSKCALHKRFGPDKARGPVLFQLKIEDEINKKLKKAS